MSASNKKKLRKELNAAAMTEKQQKELKEAKKLKAYTATFVVCMVLVVAIVIGVVLRAPIATVINRNTHAISVGDEQLTAVELNYYFVDVVTDFYNQLYESYGSSTTMYAQWFYGLSFSTPYDEQVYDKESGETWGDHFLETAKENARSVYTMYNKAIAENFKISEDTQEDIDTTLENLELAAQLGGFSNVTGYLRALYGNGSEPDSYLKYYEMNAIATEYYETYIDSLEYTDEDYREYEKKDNKYKNYNSYTYYSYTLSVSNYLTGGTLGEDGKTMVYTDDEKAAALAAAKADAKKLMNSKPATLEAFNKAIADLTINSEKENVTSSESKRIRYENISNEDVKKWVSEDGRKFGDMVTVESKSTTTDADGKETETVNGIYVVFFDNVDENKTPLANVRHILVKFEGGTTEVNGDVTYSDAEKAAAEKAAKELLKKWQDGEKADEDSFAELAKKESDDTGSKSEGGLLEDITPDDSLVENFLKWCFDDRKEGDAEVIETEYGFHVMYYCGDDELTYRDAMIKNELIERDATEWHDAQVKDVVVTDFDLSRVNYKYYPA